MDDLIRRKDALRQFTISWKGERIPETDIDNFPTQISFRDVKKILREVPSAEPEWILCTEDTKFDEPKECWVTMISGEVERLFYRPLYTPYPWTSRYCTFVYSNKDIVAYIPIEKPEPYQPQK